ncbi:helix-turn-helix domain-containing protein [Paenibacillus medicaginis]|uniref:Helix-turn-helix domain-containing protein n=1 Tax=Paenibacillus medicaginis TaxID=1470560 RepID=A0ABV5C2C6_9BACL
MNRIPKLPKFTTSRMNWNDFKSKLLLRYTLSYILIFLIPLTGVTMLAYNSAIANLRSEIEQSNVNQLNQVRMTIDSRMAELQDIAGRIAYDEHLTHYMARHPYYSREAINALANYKANSQILDDLFLYFRGDPVIYSSDGHANLEVVFNQKYKFSKWSPEELRRDLNEVAHPLMRPAEAVSVNSRQESVLSLMIPIKPNDPYPYATVIYLMEESKLTGVMDSILNNFSGNSYIFDEKGQILTSNSHGAAIPADELNKLIALGPGIHSQTLNDEQQSIVAVQSEENGWTYMTTMPSSQFFSRIVHVQTLILIVFAAVALTGVTAAILLARRQYHPIHDLLEFARVKTGAKSPDTFKSGGEWEWIRQTIHDFSVRIDIQEPYVRNHFLLTLLKHGNPDDEGMDSIIRSMGLQSPQTKDSYFVMLLTWDEFPAASRSDLDRRMIYKMFSDLELPELKAHVYGIEFSPSDPFALIVSIAEDEGAALRERIQDTADAVRARVVESFFLHPSIGVGTPYGSLGEINQSFIEAATALEFRMLGGQGSITFFENLTSSSTEAFWISKKSLLKLEQSLKQGNESVAVQMIDSIIADIRNQPVSAALLRCICFDLLNSLLKIASESGMTGVIRDIPRFTSFETLEELENTLEMLAMQICAQVERKAEQQQNSLVDDIVSYVDRQFADYTLSLEQLALKYSISTSYLSRCFKEKTGSTFSQYIWHLRMNEVIRLLLTTDDPLKDIIEQVGYLDTPNFIRKFKKETGCTPGQYRKLYADTQLDTDLDTDHTISDSAHSGAK